MEEITKKEIKKLMEIPGEGRGVIFRCIADYVRERKGEEGVKRLEKEMENLGCPLDFDKVKNMAWYPVGLRAVVFIAAKRVFGWGDKEIRDMGYEAPKFSFIVKLILGCFGSPRAVFDLAPQHWKKHYTVGVMEAAEWHKDEKNMWSIIRIKDFKLHPDLCIFLCGYFQRMAEFGGGKNVTSEETKCIHKGDPYHEFFIRAE